MGSARSESPTLTGGSVGEEAAANAAAAGEACCRHCSVAVSGDGVVPIVGEGSEMGTR